jgi:hypothetical protein
MTPVEICRANGWKVGSVLEGMEEGPGWRRVTRIRITAVGEEHILARAIWENGKDIDGLESLWSLDARLWLSRPLNPLSSAPSAPPRDAVPASPGRQP